ncbi:MAG: porin family protein [Pleurocapsa sp.]
MKIKSIVLASVLALFMPLAAQAQNVENYEDYRVSCNSGAECSDFDVNYQEQLSDDNISQTQRTRTRTRTRTRVFQRNNDYYLGGNLGLFFPGSDANTGFGGSILGGRNFSDYWSAELEFLFYGGGTDVDDLGYNFLGILANVMGKYSFNQSRTDSLYAFGGVGLGFGRVAATDDAADDFDAQGFDTSKTGFAFQLKGGVGYPINEKTDVLGQFRYIDISGDDIVNTIDGDGFSLDVGVTFKL